MHIKINIDPKIVERGDDIEITLRMMSEQREDAEEKIWWQEDDRPLWRDIVMVMIAIMIGEEGWIGISDGYKHEDLYHEFYVHPGDVADAINEMRLAGEETWVRVTSQAVGRAMQNRLDLKPRGRKNSGIPYYFVDNKEQLLRLADEFQLELLSKWIEEDGDASDD